MGIKLNEVRGNRDSCGYRREKMTGGMNWVQSNGWSGCLDHKTKYGIRGNELKRKKEQMKDKWR